MAFYKITNDAIYLYIKAKPKAREDKIIAVTDAYVKIQVKAEPTDNKANKDLVIFLADWLSVAKKDIKIIRGSKSTDKVARLPNIALIANKLSQLV